jgi:hypothetical protein
VTGENIWGLRVQRLARGEYYVGGYLVDSVKGKGWRIRPTLKIKANDPYDRIWWVRTFSDAKRWVYDRTPEGSE